MRVRGDVSRKSREVGGFDGWMKIGRTMHRRAVAGSYKEEGGEWEVISSTSRDQVERERRQ